MQENHSKSYWGPLMVAGLLILSLSIPLVYKLATPHHLVGQNLSQATLPTLSGDQATLPLQSGPFVLHVWATWCGYCQAEHPLWQSYVKSTPYPVYSLIYKDDQERVKKFLSKHGDPYQANLLDTSGTQALQWGFTGVPTTLLIDDGIIQLVFEGAMTPADFEALSIHSK